MQPYVTQAELAKQAQKRSTTYSAVLIAGILHAVAAFVFGLYYLAGQAPKMPDVIVQAPPGNVQEKIKPKDFSTLMKESPSASSAMMSKVVTAANVSNVLVPEVPEIAVDTVAFGSGFGDGFGSGMGGSGSGMGGMPPPGSPVRQRCSKQDRLKRLLDGGGSQQTEDAVMRGLDFLQTQQKSDGSWGGEFKVAMTGLALLAYLGHCETYDSPKYGETVRKAVLFLTEKCLQDDGMMRSSDENAWVYEHGIGAYALCEAYSLLKYGARKFPHLEELKEAIGKSVQIVIDGQNHDGGWVYRYAGSKFALRFSDSTEKSPGDTSVTGWQMQALKAATLTKLEFANISRCIRDGLKFLENMQGPEGGFGYRSPGDKYALTGVGGLSHQMFGKRGSLVRKAVDYFLDHPFNYGAGDASIYGWYYGTQMCFQRGGRDWTKWNDQFHDPLVKAQKRDGSWPSEGGGGADSSSAAGGDATIYRTCLFILMLEVYYRYLPATE